MSDADIGRVAATLRVIPDGFGRPHVHTGISIRRLRKNVFECRAGLKLRLLFRENASALEFFLVGDHDNVQAWLRVSEMTRVNTELTERKTLRRPARLWLLMRA